MDLLLSSTALSLLAVGTVWLAGRRDPACSPLLTSCCLLALLALPVLAQLPKYHLEVPALGGTEAAVTVSAVSGLALLWVLGFAAFALRFGLDFRALRRWRRAAIDPADPRLPALAAEARRQLNLARPVGIRLHPQAASPVIAGLLRPTIYLPLQSRQWSEDTLRMVLLHELGHVARRDLWTSLAARLSCLVHWFNPLVWWLRSRLMAQCEFACDAMVIRVGADPAGYACALCDVAEGGAAPREALAMAGRASLRQRVERLARRPGPKRSLLVGTALILTAATSFALSVVRLAAPAAPYTPTEIQLRLTADPFPAD